MEMEQMNHNPNPQGPQPQGQEQPQQDQQQEVDPKLKKEVEAFVGAISKMFHAPETKGKVYDMLKSAPPEKSIPEAVFHVNLRVAEKLKQKGQNPSMEALFTGTVVAAAELAEIGNTGGFFQEELTERNIKPVVQASLQRMVVEGVKRGLVDPVEFQAAVEPMLSEQQKQVGLEAGRRTGVPAEAGQSQAMEAYAAQAVKKDRRDLANQQSVKNRQGLMSQVAGGQ